MATAKRSVGEGRQGLGETTATFAAASPSPGLSDCPDPGGHCRDSETRLNSETVERFQKEEGYYEEIRVKLCFKLAKEPF